eukprot:8275696-Prorocentrum_lima.AAC.1
MLGDSPGGLLTSLLGRSASSRAVRSGETEDHVRIGPHPVHHCNHELAVGLLDIVSGAGCW